MGTLLSSWSLSRAAMSSWMGPSRGIAAFFSTYFVLACEDVGSRSAYAIAMSKGSSGKGTSFFFFYFFFLPFFRVVWMVSVSATDSSGPRGDSKSLDTRALEVVNNGERLRCAVALRTFLFALLRALFSISASISFISASAS